VGRRASRPPVDSVEAPKWRVQLARATELPIVGPTHLKTAKALAPTIPPFIVARADEVFE